MKNNLKQYRVAANLTQEELAQKTGVSRQTIIAIESGRYLPSLPLAFGLAKTFRVRVEDLFQE